MTLDDPERLLDALTEMRESGSRAHEAAGEEGNRAGAMRDAIYGVNTVVDALISLVNEATDA